VPVEHAKAVRDYLARLLPDGGRLTIVSNRGPLTFHRDGNSWRASRGSGGLVTALAEVGRHAPVSWVSAASDPGDRAAARALEAGGDERRRIESVVAQQLPDQEVELRLVEVPEDAYRAHYARIANPFLWFMQHEMYSLPYEPVVDEQLLRDWQTGYGAINQLLGEAAVRVAPGQRPVVLLQDYHLYLAASAIRAARPESLLLHFNHIPWPAAWTWQVLPQSLRRAICEGLLANDIVGLQTDRYATNFLATVDSFVRDARVDPAGRNVRWRGRTIFVRAYPISLDPEALLRFAGGRPVAARMHALQARVQRAGNPRLIVRVDRLEPSKNVLRGFLAFEALLARRPDLRRTVRFLAIQASSREQIAEYARYANAVREVVARINHTGDEDEAPIWLVDGSDYETAIAALRLADVVLVNPVVDGMNLVAKEAVLVGDGALVLSETAGAAEQLGANALTVAAADVAGTSHALERALAMDDDERTRRLRRLRASVREEDLAWWLARQLRDLVFVASGQRPPSRQLRDAVRSLEPILDAAEATADAPTATASRR
jgi:trehalose 6-phosphate synthase